jgi:uncharacterized alpha-E superfamily protein
MLSRVADSIYWMSRYIERAENVARFMAVNLTLRLDAPPGSDEQWQPLIDTTGDAKTFAERYTAATQENVIKFLTFDPEYSSSIFSCLRAARENARSVREVISSEMWEQLNQFYLMVQDASHSKDVTDPQELFASVKMSSHLFTGVTDATMTHGEGWHFCQLGRKLERADKTSRILDVKYFLLLPTAADVGTTYDDIQWAAVLRSASAFEMYRKRYGRLLPDRIVEFLLLDAEFPRSIRYCLASARDSVHAISGTPSGMFRHPAEKLLGEICSELAYTPVTQIIDDGLHEYLDRLQTRMNRVSKSIAETFFATRAVRPTTIKKPKPRTAAASRSQPA